MEEESSKRDSTEYGNYGSTGIGVDSSEGGDVKETRKRIGNETIQLMPKLSNKMLKLSSLWNPPWKQKRDAERLSALKAASASAPNSKYDNFFIPSDSSEKFEHEMLRYGKEAQYEEEVTNYLKQGIRNLRIRARKGPKEWYEVGFTLDDPLENGKTFSGKILLDEKLYMPLNYLPWEDRIDWGSDDDDDDDDTGSKENRLDNNKKNNESEMKQDNAMEIVPRPTSNSNNNNNININNSTLNPVNPPPSAGSEIIQSSSMDTSNDGIVWDEGVDDGTGIFLSNDAAPTQGYSAVVRTVRVDPLPTISSVLPGKGKISPWELNASLSKISQVAKAGRRRQAAQRALPLLNKYLVSSEWVNDIIWDDEETEEYFDVEQSMNNVKNVFVSELDPTFASVPPKQENHQPVVALSGAPTTSDRMQLHGAATTTTTTTTMAAASSSAAAGAAGAMQKTSKRTPVRIVEKERLCRIYEQYYHLFPILGIELEQRELEIVQQYLKEKNRDIGNLNDPSMNTSGSGFQGVKPSWRKQLPKIIHSLPSSSLKWVKSELRSPAESYHRPSRPKATEKGKPIRFRIKLDNPSRHQGVRAFAGNTGSRAWKEEEVTGATGQVILMEYSEQYPIVLSNVGMMSSICNFYKFSADKKADLQPAAPKGPLGRTITFASSDASPFVSPLPTETLVTAIYNNLGVAPIFQHQKPNTDFLLIRRKKNSMGFSQHGDSMTNNRASGVEEEEILIRPINKVFTVGQIEPSGEIFQPKYNQYFRDGFRNWILNYVSFHVAQMLVERRARDPTMQDVIRKFPNYVDTNAIDRAFSNVREGLMKNIKKSASGEISTFHLNREIEQFKRTLQNVDPESVCIWESVQLGLSHLHQANIFYCSKTEVLNVEEDIELLLQERELLSQFEASMISTINAINESKVKVGTKPKYGPPVTSGRLSENDKRLIATCRGLLRELQVTPWFLSKCYRDLHLDPNHFTNRFPIGTKMRIHGLGDPSGIGEAISFLPALESNRKGRKRRIAENAANAAAAAAEQAKAAENARNEDDQQQQQFKYYKTEADLRKLDMSQMGKIIQQLGAPAKDVEGMERWDRSWFVKKIANSKNGMNRLDGALAKFRRQGESSGVGSEPSNESKKAYMDDLLKVFRTQMKSLQSKEPPKASKNVDDSSSSDSSDEGETKDESAAALKILEEFVPRPPGWKPQKVLRRLVREGPGFENVRIEYIKNKARISEFIMTKEREKIELENRVAVGRFKPPLTLNAAIESVGLLHDVKHDDDDEAGEGLTKDANAAASGLDDGAEKKAKEKAAKMKEKDPSLKSNVVKRPRESEGGESSAVAATPMTEEKRAILMEINNKLAPVLEVIIDNPDSFNFRYDVDKNEVPKYYQRIKQPMSLERMKVALDNLWYNSRADFDRDMRRIHNNSETFNGQMHPITIQAKNILDLSKTELSKIGKEMEELEAKLKMLSGGALPKGGANRTAPSKHGSSKSHSKSGSSEVEREKKKAKMQHSGKSSAASSDPSFTAGAGAIPQVRFATPPMSSNIPTSSFAGAPMNSGNDSMMVLGDSSSSAMNDQSSFLPDESMFASSLNLYENFLSSAAADEVIEEIHEEVVEEIV